MHLYFTYYNEKKYLEAYLSITKLHFRLHSWRLMDTNTGKFGSKCAAVDAKL